jgi:hypothetical protein
LISLHNYFIMHDIKYFFSIKIIRQFREAKKNFRGDKLLKALPKNTIFQSPAGQLPPSPPGPTWICPWMQVHHFFMIGVINVFKCGFFMHADDHYSCICEILCGCIYVNFSYILVENIIINYNIINYMDPHIHIDCMDLHIDLMDSYIDCMDPHINRMNPYMSKNHIS